MKIGLNLLFLTPDAGGGVETYVRRLVDELLRLDTANEYFLFLGSTTRIAGSANATIVRCNVDSHNRALRYSWEQTILPLQVMKHGIQMLHSMNYVAPIACPCKSLVTFQDLSYREPVVAMSSKRRLGLSLFSTLSARFTDGVVTVSEFSKRSICAALKVPESRVRVVPSGPGWNASQPSAADIESTLNKYGIARPYLTAFAGGYQHKNIPRMLSAFQSACRDLPHHLVLIGRLPPNVELSPPVVEPEFQKRIHSLGHIPTADIYPILGGSELFLFPSLYEGFGFPLLEAQEAGVPVACSNAASIPEVAGTGAVYFDPLSVDEIEAIIRKCLADSGLRKRLVQLGFENVRRFSWTRAAKAHIALYDEILSQ